MFESFVVLGMATLFLVGLAVYADRNREESGHGSAEGASGAELSLDAVPAACAPESLADKLTILGGLPSAWLGSVAHALDWDCELLCEALGIDPAIAGSQDFTRRLTVEESSRLLTLVDLIMFVHGMVERSGDPEGFCAENWLGQWLRNPCPAYGDRRPMEYLNSSEGLRLVRRTLQQMESGAYA